MPDLASGSRVESVSVAGLAAEFDDREHFREAFEQARSAGFTRIRCLGEPVFGGAASVKRSVVVGALLGAMGGVLLQWFSDPVAGWPWYTEIGVEMAVLGGALAGVVHMLLQDGTLRPDGGPFVLVLEAEETDSIESMRLFLSDFDPAVIREVRKGAG